MAELLHSLETLTEVATSFQEPARSWARALIAIWHGELPAGLPTGDQLWDPIVARCPPGFAQAALAALTAPEPPSEGLAATLAFAATWGVDLGPPDEVVRAARRHLGRAGNADLHLVRLIADREPLTPELLQAASAIPNVDEPGAQSSLAALVIRYAVSVGAGAEVIADVLAPLDDDLHHRLFDALGLALMPPPLSIDPDDAVEHGANLADAPMPSLLPSRGGRKGRARAWLRQLTEGSRDPLWIAASALLRRDPSPNLVAMLLAQAAHARFFEPGDPVDDVVRRHAGYRPGALVAARAAGLTGDVAEALESFELGSLHIGPLLLDADPAVLAPTAIELAVQWPTLAPTSIAIAALSWLPVDPALALAPSLARPFERTGALTIAGWSPTPETLDALLRMPVPRDPAQRCELATALSRMGSPDAATRCRAILDLPDTPATPDALALLDALHLS